MKELRVLGSESEGDLNCELDIYTKGAERTENEGIKEMELEIDGDSGRQYDGDAYFLLRKGRDTER